MNRRPQSRARARDHLAIQGLINELPDIGEEWSEENRALWLEAMRTTLVLLYPSERGVQESTG